MTYYTFRMMGLPPAQGTKRIKIKGRQKVADAKNTLRKEFRIHESLVIQLIFKGKPLTDTEDFEKTLSSMGYDPRADTITVITQQVGGMHV